MFYYNTTFYCLTALLFYKFIQNILQICELNELFRSKYVELGEYFCVMQSLSCACIVVICEVEELPHN